MILSVCPGREISLVCRTNSTLVTWYLTVPHAEVTAMRSLTTTSSQVVELPVNISGTIINIARTSKNGSLPLESILTTSATDSLNSTRVNCSSRDNKSSIIIHVIGHEGN